MKFDIYFASADNNKESPVLVENIGYIENDKFDEKYFLNLMKSLIYDNDKNDNLFVGRSPRCVFGLVFYNPLNEKYYIPLDFEWKVLNKFEELEPFFVLEVMSRSLNNDKK